MLKKILLNLSILIFATLSLPSSEALDKDRIVIYLWKELKPMVSLEGEYPVPREKAIKKLLEDARVILSAMIYGYTFIYTPSDRARRVLEVFTLNPVAEIKWGDKQLKVLQTEVKKDRLYASISYDLIPFQRAKREAWSSNSIPLATGFGKGSVFEGDEGRAKSFDNAIKEAIRNFLRPRIYNKPREIRGELLLWDAPYTAIEHGEYVTRVRIKLIVKEVIPYRIF